METPKIRFYLGHAGIGMALSAVFITAILWRDPLGLGGLLLRAPDYPWPLLLLWFFCGLTFGSVQLGVAIMFHGER